MNRAERKNHRFNVALMKEFKADNVEAAIGDRVASLYRRTDVKKDRCFMRPLIPIESCSYCVNNWGHHCMFCKMTDRIYQCSMCAEIDDCWYCVSCFECHQDTENDTCHTFSKYYNL